MQITGAGNGIGRATALLFAAEGCAVGVVDRDVMAGEAVAAAIRRNGGTAVFAECDVSSEASINDAVAAVAEGLGGLNILVNVAYSHKIPGVLPLFHQNVRCILGDF